LLRYLLVEAPTATRARELLAWVLEASGRLTEERALRAELLEEAEPDDFHRTLAYGRALERAGDYRGALARYRQAYRVDPEGSIDLRGSIDRMRYRLSPEAVVGALIYSDPSGSSHELHTGLALPLSADLALSVSGSFGRATGGNNLGQTTAGGTLTAALALGYGHDLTSILRVSGNYRELVTEEAMPDEQALSVGASVEARVATGRPIQAHLRADLHMPWREAANTIREGGAYDGITAHLYALPFGHSFVLDVGTRARSMTLHPLMDQPEPRGSQVVLFAGADWVAWVDPSSVARGQILDEDLAWPTYLADSLTFSYRHYEGFTDDEFGERLVLAERDRIDELSTTARKAIADGILGAELRGGVGHDWARDKRMWRAGGALLVSPTPASRINITYDVANESTSGFVGRRHAGWFTLHVDL
jgi:hypothetical protein